ncbi:MAB_1171c family putative transporter [Streptomyces sp. CRN 30]|uniref:MAB_1171c family putative transporter n=1 Tax=Streptomyces sp. CRN 30 TaxID=3075613 RepID=UPI002A80795D|nr:MAB_1171c family putative transporter [Streptomyces sp. CRN 30]
MSRWLAYGPVAVAVLLAWAELRSAGRRHTSGPGRRLAAFAALLGAAMLALAPSTITCAERVLPGWPAPLHLAGRELEMAALSLLPGIPARLGMPVRAVCRPLHRLLTATALPACLLLFLAADADTTGGAVTVEDRGWVALALFGTVFTAYSVWCLACFTLPVLAHTRTLPPGPSRLGFRLIGAAAGVGLLWALWGIAGIAGMVRDHHQGAGQDPVAVLLGTGCLALAAAGATTVRWRGAVVGWARRLRAGRDLRALAALWSALHSVLPNTALPVAGVSPGRRGHGARDAEFALYRRIVEIRDGGLALSRHIPEQLAEWTGAGLERFPADGPYGEREQYGPYGERERYRPYGERERHGPSGPYGAGGVRAVVGRGVGLSRSGPAYTVAAVAEAAALAAAIEAVRAGRGARPPAPAGITPATGAGGGDPDRDRGRGVFAGTVEDEAAWLCQVAAAFEFSPTVAYVRCRARAEFTGQEPSELAEPTEVAEPTEPVKPVKPVEPTEVAEPVEVAVSSAPASPSAPSGPPTPATPSGPSGPPGPPGPPGADAPVAPQTDTADGEASAVNGEASAVDDVAESVDGGTARWPSTSAR